MAKVLVFGSFDGVHEGHREMLRQAKALGSYLIAVLAADSVIEELKGHAPKYPLKTRLSHLKNERIADDVVAGDSEISSWKVLKKYKPDVIALGYDQFELKAALDEYFENLEKKPTITLLKAHKPELYKSSLLNQ